MRGRETARPRAVAAYDFHAGTDTRAYEYFGAHRTGDGRYIFRLYAPHAERAALCGAVTEGEPIRMDRIGDGVFETAVTADIPLEGMCYYFLLDGMRAVSDPYGRRGLYGELGGSLICSKSTHQWQDGEWMSRRGGYGAGDRPMNLYEVHLGSFSTRGGRSNTGGDAYLNYRALAALLADYVSDMGYTHVKLMPLTEHRGEAAHGYETGGLFAPTSRHGTPDDLRAMIDRLHSRGLGAVMDLSVGMPCEGGEIPDITRPETQSMLLSAVLFWLREFHLDGLCLVGLRRWVEAGGEMYAEAMRFLPLLCAAAHAEFPTALLIAEDDIGDMTGQSSMGFDLLSHGYFADDLLRYLHAGPERRRGLRDLPLRLMAGARDESYLLPLSHRAVCAGHSSLIGQMDGGYSQRFAGVRLALAFQAVMPGKKLLFMGCELGQHRTWEDTIPPDWFLGELETHARLIRYVRALNHFYRGEPCLWQGDRMAGGLAAADIAAEGDGGCLFACLRTDRDGRHLLALFHCSRERAVRCRVAGVGAQAYRAVFSTDSAAFGGSGCLEAGMTVAAEGDMLTLELPPLTALLLAPIGTLGASADADK